MKKVVLLLILLLVPIKANAYGITKVDVTGLSEMKQGETSEFLVDLYIDTSSPEGMMFMSSALIQIEYDVNALVIENVTAANSEIIIGGAQGSREILGYFDFEKYALSYETSCFNNIFCNMYRFKVNVYAKGTGETDLKIKTAFGFFGDLSKGENFTADDVSIIEYPANLNKRINIKATQTPISVPEEPAESTQKVTPVTPTIPKITTTKPTTTTSSTTLATTPSSEPTTKEQSKEENDEELKKDKEKREKINKKIFFYGGIALGVIILLIIVNFIINKIRNRKLDKALKNL